MLEDIIQSLFDAKNSKIVDIKELITEGKFYPDDLVIRLTRLDDLIIEYYNNFAVDDLKKLMIIENIVSLYTSYSGDFTFKDLKPVDLFYLFFQLVEFSTGEPFYFELEDRKIKFEKDAFCRFDYQNYKMENKQIAINNRLYSPPSMYVQSLLNTFGIIYSIKNPDLIESISNGEYNSNWMFFIGNKKLETADEIANLYYIYNQDVSEKSKKEIENIISICEETSKVFLNIDGIKTHLLMENIPSKIIY